MFSEQLRKEYPILGLLGMGGGIGGKLTSSAAAPISATGGNTSAGLSPGNGYRYHVFTSPGNFVVASGVQEIEIFGVGAGGPGGVHQPSGTQVGYTAGGGAGGIFYTTAFEVGPGTHPVTVGAQGTTPDSAMIQPGADTTFVHGSTTLTAKGGGVGGYYGNSAPPGSPAEWKRGGEGGSGGGNCYGSAPAPFGPVGPGIQPTLNPGVANLTNYGNNGGDHYTPQDGSNRFSGGGGGGAGAVGSQGGPNNAGDGGAGQPFPAFAAPLIAPDIPSPVRPNWTPEVGPTGLYGGGGGSSGSTNPTYHPITPGSGGAGGGGNGVSASTTAGSPTAKNGLAFTGGGAGGGGQSGGAKPRGGTGGSGLLVVRYQPGATGPSINSSGGVKIEDSTLKNTYHVFTYPNSDNFTVDAPVSCYYLCVAGGGTAGTNSGGGGGAGGAYSNSFDVPSPLRQSAFNASPGTTYPITVGDAGANSAIGPGVITATAGGNGGPTEGNGSPGGSGGGGGNNYTSSSTTAGSASPSGQGNPGGRQIAPAPGTSGGGGGGGWSEAGYSTGNVPSPQAPKRGHGGDGLALPSLPAPILAPAIPSPNRTAWTNAVGPTGLFAGGGGGQVDFPIGSNPTNGGAGGGGHGQNPDAPTGETAGVYGTGGGGGSGNPSGLPGGAGIVIIYYPWS